MRKQSAALCLLLCALWLTGSVAASADDWGVVHPKVSEAVLVNPGIGFTSFHEVPDPETTDTVRYPRTSIAYYRFYWAEIEPERGRYDWSGIDAALEAVRANGMTLMLGLMPHAFAGESPGLPAWFEQSIGGAQYTHDGFWALDYEDPRYLDAYGALVRAFAARYDGDPAIESVDVRIIGAWGEGYGSELLSQHARESLVNAYTEGFRATRLIFMLTDPATNALGLAVNAGFRADSLGDMPPASFVGEDGAWYWCHMYDYYPEQIAACGVGDSWKSAPVSFEIAWDFEHWERQGFNFDYIIDQSVKWHISSVNGKSSDIPPAYRERVDEFLKRIGYRYALRRFAYAGSVRAGDTLNFESWWENLGNAPCYRDYRLALRILDGETAHIIRSDADARAWLPGDVIVNAGVRLPDDLNPGWHPLQIGLLAPDSDVPALALANEGEMDGGWLPLGLIEIAE